MKTKTLYWILTAWLTFLALSMIAGCKTNSVVEGVLSIPGTIFCGTYSVEMVCDKALTC